MINLTHFNSLSKDDRADIALCALIKILTGQMTKHLTIMKDNGKDTDTFIDTYETLINKIASSPGNVINILKLLIED